MRSFHTAAVVATIVFGMVLSAAPQNRYGVSHEAAGGSGSPPVVVLRDNTAGVEAAVAPSEGGELSSLRVKHRGEWIELIYRARDYSSRPGFRGKASFLWPAVGGQYLLGTNPGGSCVEGVYRVGDSTYPIPCHGFVKTMPWDIAGQSADDSGARVSLEVHDSGKTRPSYPFGFRVRVTYELAGGALTIAYRVSSSDKNSRPMPFSIGNHVAFRVPFLKGSDPAAFILETPNAFELVRDANGLVTTATKERSFAKGVKLGDFDAMTALPLTGYRGTPYALITDPKGLALRITQRTTQQLPEPLVRFNIYGSAREGYLSPEPWFGLQNSLNLGKGLVTIAPGTHWDWTLELRPEIQ